MIGKLMCKELVPSKNIIPVRCFTKYLRRFPENLETAFYVGVNIPMNRLAIGLLDFLEIMMTLSRDFSARVLP